ncbi:unnamed protein product [Durusdinium trenchii]|uniref:Uncharacterized protein n=1 Tax=Durusdinium trenchii TaxID=1381693 RepID=A0ABP0KRA9_9DINO
MRRLRWKRSRIRSISGMTASRFFSRTWRPPLVNDAGRALMLSCDATSCTRGSFRTLRLLPIPQRRGRSSCWMVCV